MPTNRSHSQYSRTGARRAGDAYQDIVALELIIDWIEHNDRYQWIKLEADEMGFLDDVIALRQDGRIQVLQVKYSTNPDMQNDPWTWEKLLERSKTKNGNQNLSLLQKWASSLREIKSQWSIFEASVYSNRRAATELEVALENGYIIFDQVHEPDIQQEIVKQLGGEDASKEFFKNFKFRLNQPGLSEIEEGLRRRFGGLGGTETGWLNLKNELCEWVINRNEPPPGGLIILSEIKKASLWYTLQSLPQRFEIPSDYVLPSEEFHQDLLTTLEKHSKKCLVITASPGVGKSTYVSYLYDHFCEVDIPVIRHHYYLSMEDRNRVYRLDHVRAAESLMHDLELNYAESLQGLDSRNPNHKDLSNQLERSGSYYEDRGKCLIVIVDGLDHVWREQKSIKELEDFLNILLPPVKGVIVLLATQPVEDNKLPRSLIRCAPKGEWLHLPLLDRASVKVWLGKHAREISNPGEGELQDWMLDRLSDALYKKSKGHPLHIRYTLKSLLERNKQVTEDNILELPECAHEDITKYYDELWASLDEESREILHLISACPFPWPREGIFDAVDPSAQNRSQVRKSLCEVEHLLINSDMGLRPFHSSLYTFIEATSDHNDYIIIEKKRALNWLKTKAPLYWRWAYEWIIEAELGNKTPLVNGPNRNWAIDAVSQRYAKEDIELIISKSTQTALAMEDLPRAVELGLLQEYCNTVYDFEEYVLEILIAPQLILEEDNYLRARLRSNLEQLDGKILAGLASNEYRYSNDLEIKRIFKTLIHKHRHPQENGRHTTWQEDIRPILETTALLDNSQSEKTIQWAIGNRDKGYSEEMLFLYISRLRALKKSEHLRSVLTTWGKCLEKGDENTLSIRECNVIIQDAVLLALEEGLDIDQELANTNSANPILVVYLKLRNINLFNEANIRLPTIDQLDVKQFDFSLWDTKIRNFYRYFFLCLLANYLLGRTEENANWFKNVGKSTWSHQFLHKLDKLAYDASVYLLTKRPITPGWVYNQLNDFPRIKWSEDRDESKYSEASVPSIQIISFDLFIFSMSFDKTLKIDVNDLEKIYNSSYCFPMKWLELYLDHERIWFSKDATHWLIQNQISQLESEIEEFPTRAEEYARLSQLAATHGLPEKALDLIHKACEFLVAHYHHKDMLIGETMDIIHLCNPLYQPGETPNSYSYLLQLAPAIAKIDLFTDSDETGHYPRSLATILADINPSKLPKYYLWLSEIEEPYDALHALNVLVRTMDLSDPIAKAIAQTAIDEESLGILNERASEGDNFAVDIIDSIEKVIGKIAGNSGNDSYQSTQLIGNQSENIHKDEVLPPFSDFPPDQAIEFFTMINNKRIIYREEKVKEWINYWISNGKKVEVYKGLEKVIESGFYFRNTDEVFDLCLSLFGKDQAYPWLIQAQNNDSGWYRYYTKEENARKRWEIIKEYYPEKWFDFIQKTFSTGSHTFYRLISYLIYFDQEEMAKAVLDRIVSCVLEYTSPGNFPNPGWINDEQQND